MLTYKPEDLKLRIRHDGLDEERELVFKPLSAIDQRSLVSIIARQKEEEDNSEMIEAIFKLLAKRIGKEDAEWLNENFDFLFITELIQHVSEKENDHRLAQKKKASSTQKSSSGSQKKDTKSPKRIRMTG